MKSYYKQKPGVSKEKPLRKKKLKIEVDTNKGPLKRQCLPQRRGTASALQRSVYQYSAAK
jgi:hypothetical protein